MNPAQPETTTLKVMQLKPRSPLLLMYLHATVTLLLLLLLLLQLQLTMLMRMTLPSHASIASESRPRETNRQRRIITCQSVTRWSRVTGAGGPVTAAPAAVDGQRRLTRAAAAAAARAVAAYQRLAAAARRRNMQGESEALGGVDDDPGCVGGHGGAEHERHGAGTSDAQAGGDGETAALGLCLRDVAGGGFRWWGEGGGEGGTHVLSGRRNEQVPQLPVSRLQNY